MPPHSGRVEQPRAVTQEKFRTPEEELAYLRDRIKEKEQELETSGNKLEQERIAQREIAEYGAMPAATILHETVVIPESEAMRKALQLEPETHDAQIDELLKLVGQHGIRNALTVVARMKNPHLEDDLHRALVLEPRHFAAILHFAEILLGADRKADARFAFAAALSLHPHLSRARQALSEP